MTAAGGTAPKTPPVRPCSVKVENERLTRLRATSSCNALAIATFSTVVLLDCCVDVIYQFIAMIMLP